MRTVELLPDPELDRGVRELWDRLRAASLPSLAAHPHPTNRPHLTVVTAPSLTGLLTPDRPAPGGPVTDRPVPGSPGTDRPAPRLPAGLLPVAAELGPVRFLGRALVREVTPIGPLRDLHALVWQALEDAWPPPAEWVPHLSLALRVPPESRAAALRALAAVPPARGHFVAARSFDTEDRTVSGL